MEQVTHREMRNRSGEILRRVEAGESFLVSNNGRPAAVIGPPPEGDILDELISRGEARPASADITILQTIEPADSSVPTNEIIADVRGER